MAVAQPEKTSTETPRGESIQDLFAALESPLLSYALRLVKDLSGAEDLVQEAFMKLHADFDQIREPRRWLYRTVHNLGLNHQRKMGRLVPLEGSPDDAGDASRTELADSQPLPDEQIIRGEAVGLVRLSLKNLNARDRELVRLKFTENMTYQQISDRTGLTIGNVGYLLHHALKAIAAELGRSGGF